MSNIKPISELDFDQIKASLVEWMRSQPEFNSYNFEGAALNAILDVLAYNTHYNSFYANLVHSESFLDTAVKRSSIVSRAKSLGYVPRSDVASEAVLDLIVNSVPPGTPEFSIDRGTTFKASLNGQSFTFYVISNQVVETNGIDYQFNNVVIKEGSLVTNKFTVDNTANPAQYFKIPNAGVDTTTMRVYVQQNSTSLDVEEFFLATNVFDIDGSSPVFFLQESYDGLFEIYFGDNILGKKLSDGNVVNIEYIVGSGNLPNGANAFTLEGDIAGYTNITVITDTPAFGGGPRETTESIKFYAPKQYARQNRSVIADDYKVFLKQNVENLDSVAVWGGEDNVPPEYGKVFISMKPVDGYYFSDTTKNDIIASMIRENNVVVVRPTFVDPEYIYVTMSTSVTYNRNKTLLSKDQIKALVTNAINTYMTQNVGDFDSGLIYSKLLEAIDSVDQSVVGNRTHIKLSKRIENINAGLERLYNLEFCNGIEPGTISSTPFTVSLGGVPTLVRLIDDPTVTYTNTNEITGITKVTSPLRLIDSVTGTVVQEVGEVEYSTGYVSLIARIYSIPAEASNITVYAEPAIEDVFSVRNKLLILDDQSRLESIFRFAGLDVQVIQQ